MKKLGIILLGLLLLVGCSGKNNVVEEPKEPEEKEEVVVEEPKIYSPLRGEEVAEEVTRTPIAIMLDNHTDARPQMGINNTDILYEYKVEGQFTRYMAIFNQELPTHVGPVRSARPYFVDRAYEDRAIYIHWGGSEAGYAEISKVGVDEIDGIAYEGIYMFRNKEVGKRAPHNGYIKYEDIEKWAEKKGVDLNKGVAVPFNYNHEGEVVGETATEIDMNFFPQYSTRYEYNPDSFDYTSYRLGELMVDEADNSPYRPVNIIVQFATSQVVGPKDTLKIDIVGSGEGYLFNGGVVNKIKWEKADLESKTSYTLEDGKPITLLPGKTLICVMDSPEELVFNLPVEESTTEETQETNSNVAK